MFCRLGSSMAAPDIIAKARFPLSSSHRLVRVLGPVVVLAQALLVMS